MTAFRSTGSSLEPRNSLGLLPLLILPVCGEAFLLRSIAGSGLFFFSGRGTGDASSDIFGEFAMVYQAPAIESENESGHASLDVHSG